jgi:hypothetical protein
VRGHIRVRDVGPERRELACDFGFAAADSAGQANAEHVPD